MLFYGSFSINFSKSNRKWLPPLDKKNSEWVGKCNKNIKKVVRKMKMLYFIAIKLLILTINTRFTGKLLKRNREIVSEGLQLYQKETSTQVFSCENCEIFKNNIFHRAPPYDCFYFIFQ